LRACCPDARVVALISLGTPAVFDGRAHKLRFLESCPKPKLFISGTQDGFGPPGVLEEVVERAADPKLLVRIEGDHYLAGHLDEMRLAIKEWVGGVVVAR